MSKKLDQASRVRETTVAAWRIEQQATADNIEEVGLDTWREIKPWQSGMAIGHR